MSSVRLFSILIALFTAGLAAPALAQDDVFVDRFQAGIQRAVVDGGASWWRRGSGIEVRLACDTVSEVQVVAAPGGGWVFAFGALPAGVVEIGNGVLEVELECPDGVVDVAVTATSGPFDSADSVVLALVGEPVEPGPPTLTGVDLSGDGVAEIVNQDGELVPGLAWVKAFPVTVGLVGDADTYSASLGSIDGSSWTFNEPSSGPYSLTANRAGLEDSATGNLELREALITSLGASSTVDNGINLNVDCNVSGEKSFNDNLADLVPIISTTYSSSDLPTGVDLSPDGLLDYDFSCSLGSPENVNFNVTPTINSQGNSQALDDLLVNVTIDGVGQPNPPVLNGIVNPPINNDDGVLTPNLDWIKDFPLTVEISGDANSYSASLGSVDGSSWTFEESTSGPYTLTAHRDGLEDSATGTLSLIEAQLEGLGPYVNDNGIISLSIQCEDELNEDFLMNTESLTPTVNTTYDTTTLPVGSSLDGNTFTYTPSCSPGSPTNTSFGVTPTIDAQGNDKTLDQVVVEIDITGVEDGTPPEVFGLNATFNDDDDINYFVNDDNGTLFINPIEYICGPNRERQLKIVGDADSYELVNPPTGMTLEDDIIHYAPPNESACDDSPNGLESELVLRAHRDGLTTDIEKTAYAMNPRIDCVTHYPGIPAGGGTPPDPETYCDDMDDNVIDDIIELSYNIETPHNIQIHVRPSLDDYTPDESYTYQGQNFPSFMGLDSSSGNINANPDSSQAGFYGISFKVSNGAKETPWTALFLDVVE